MSIFNHAALEALFKRADWEIASDGGIKTRTNLSADAAKGFQERLSGIGPEVRLTLHISKAAVEFLKKDGVPLPKLQPSTATEAPTRSVATDKNVVAAGPRNWAKGVDC